MYCVSYNIYNYKCICRGGATARLGPPKILKNYFILCKILKNYFILCISIKKFKYLATKIEIGPPKCLS